LAQVDRERVATRLQYDYLAGYLALHRGDIETAEEVAGRHAQHPVPRWRARFATLAEQLQQRRALDSGSRLVSGDATGPDGAAAIEAGSADLASIDRDPPGTRGAEQETPAAGTIQGRPS